jgi:antirestriction protein ArdC
MSTGTTIAQAGDSLRLVSYDTFVTLEISGRPALVTPINRTVCPNPLTIAHSLADEVGVTVQECDHRALPSRFIGAYYPDADLIRQAPFIHPSSHAATSTLLHELIHASGSRSRLNRESLLKYGSETFTRHEELVCQLGSYVLCLRFGVRPCGTSDPAVWLPALAELDESEQLEIAVEVEAGVLWLTRSR